MQEFNQKSIDCLKASMKEANREQWDGIKSRLPHRVFWPLFSVMVTILMAIGAFHVQQMRVVASLEVKLLEKHAELHESVSIMNALFEKQLKTDTPKAEDN